MLVLSRKRGQSIILGDGVTVTVLSWARGRVQLGIKACRTIAVTRPEARKRPPRPQGEGQRCGSTRSP